MENAERLYQESLSLFHSGDLPRAIVKLEEAITLNPQFPDALEALGVFYSKVDRLDDAIHTMKRLAQVSPNHIMAHANLSRFYVQKGMILEAEQEQAEARRLSWKAELQTQKQAGKTVHRSAEEEEKERERELKDRIARYEKVIALDSNDVLGYFSLGTAYLDGKLLREAREAFQKAIEVNPEHSPSYFSLGLALESLGERADAIRVYEKGIPIADRRGDIIPLRKMEARLKMLKNPS